MTKIFLLLLVTLSPMAYADELKKIQICMDKMKELCGANYDQKCIDKKWGQLAPACKYFHDRAAKEGLKTATKHLPSSMQKCLDLVQKLCPFNSKLAEEDPKKASEEYETCIQKKTADLTNPECKEFAESSKKALEEIKQQDKPAAVKIPKK